MEKLVPIINRHETINKSLVENTAITLVRLGLVTLDITAQVLASFVHPWCIALRTIRDDIEKEHRLPRPRTDDPAQPPRAVERADAAMRRVRVVGDAAARAE